MKDHKLVGKSKCHCETGLSENYPLRLSLDDNDGELAIRELRIHNAPNCEEQLNILRKHIINYPLSEIDTVALQKSPKLNICNCLSVILETICDLQEMYK